MRSEEIGSGGFTAEAQRTQRRLLLFLEISRLPVRRFAGSQVRRLQFRGITAEAQRTQRRLLLFLEINRLPGRRFAGSRVCRLRIGRFTTKAQRTQRRLFLFLKNNRPVLVRLAFCGCLNSGRICSVFSVSLW